MLEGEIHAFVRGRCVSYCYGECLPPSCTLGLVTIIDIYYTYFLYMLMYVSFTYPCMCCFFSFFIHMVLITYMKSIIFVSHKEPWWVLFKVFKKYKLSKSTCHKLSSCKVFKSLCYNRFYCIQQVNMSWVIYDFSNISFVCCGFIIDCQKGRLLRTYFV